MSRALYECENCTLFEDNDGDGHVDIERFGEVFDTIDDSKKVCPKCGFDLTFQYIIVED